MKFLRDYEGRKIRLTGERLKHILEHPEMKLMSEKIEEALANPESVVQSQSDSDTYLHYRFYIGTKVGDKYLCVVVKMKPGDPFILTAYLTNMIKKGKVIWPKK